MLRHVLVAVERASGPEALISGLADPNTRVEQTVSEQFRLEQLAAHSCDMLVVSRALLPDPPEDALGVLKELPERPSVVVLCPTEDPEERVHLLASGCDAVLNACLPAEELVAALGTILAKRQQGREEGLRGQAYLGKPSLDDFVSSSPTMRTFMNVVRRVAHRDVTLLILGETGVGKERLAAAIHAEGPRGSGPFIAVNCGAFPETLLESELFGHERGAFTGASRTRRGCFELAHGGTLFLDEVGEMPYHLQVKLLRALQEREIQRLGAEQPISVDVRIMAASHRDLAGEVEAHQFRRDLYYRLSVVRLTLPPLRERMEDIPDLVRTYIRYFRSRIGSDVTDITDEALVALRRYTWPGNVRELINVIERAMILCEGAAIQPEDLPEEIYHAAVSPKDGSRRLVPETLPSEWLARPLKELRGEFIELLERAYLTGLLERNRGRINKTAAQAGIRPRSLFTKMRQYGLAKEQFRQPPQDG